jgi:hypothetical protein
MLSIPFQLIDWSEVSTVEFPGESGVATWKTLEWEGLRVRLVEYSPGYLADHWCQKGHIVHCLEGTFISELSTGEKILLEKGDSYIVSDNLSYHRSITDVGAKLLIIDGNFLSSSF